MVVEITMDTFALRRSVRDVLQAYHVSHLEGVTLFVWQSIPLQRAGNLLDDGQDQSCWILTFVLTYDISRFLGHYYINVTATSKTLFLSLPVQAPAYEEALDWIQFEYTGVST